MRREVGPGRDAAVAAPLGVGRVRRLLTLRTFPAYANLPPDQLAVVAEYTREAHFRAGAYLSREGRPPASVYFIVDGEVELRRSGKPLRRLADKAVVGGLPAFAREAQGYDVVAVRDTVALELSIEDSQDIFEDHFPLLRTVLRAMSTEVIGTRKRAGPTAGYSDEPGDECPCPERPLDLVERMARLRASMSFASSRLEVIAELAREAVEERHPAGTLLWREGEETGFWYVLVSGVVSCESRETGQRFRFGPGDALGSLDSLAEKPRWYDARVTSDLVALRLESETMLDLFEDHFELATDLLALLARAILRFYDAAAGLSPEGGGA